VLVRGRQPPPGTVFEVELPAAPPAWAKPGGFGVEKRSGLFSLRAADL